MLRSSITLHITGTNISPLMHYSKSSCWKKGSGGLCWTAVILVAWLIVCIWLCWRLDKKGFKRHKKPTHPFKHLNFTKSDSWGATSHGCVLLLGLNVLKQHTIYFRRIKPSHLCLTLTWKITCRDQITDVWILHNFHLLYKDLKIGHPHPPNTQALCEILLRILFWFGIFGLCIILT